MINSTNTLKFTNAQPSTLITWRAKEYICTEQVTYKKYKLKNSNHLCFRSLQRYNVCMNYFSPIPSSLRSTFTMKNMKPLAPDFSPPTNVFTQPATINHY